MPTERGAVHRVSPSSVAVTTKAFEEAMFELDGSSEYSKWLIYGDSGAGKTVLAGSLPGRVLYLAGEPGYIAAARQGARGQVRIIPDPATAVAGLSWLEEGNAGRFDWIVVDGLSTMNSKFLLAYTAEAFDANPSKRAARNLPDKPDYFNTQNFTKSFVARMIDLPCNVLFTAHAMRPEGEDGELLVYPAIQGKGYEVSNYVAGLMHVVGYMATRVVKTKTGQPRQQRRVLFQTYVDPKTETHYFAKDQFNALGLVQTILDPTFGPEGVKMPELIEMIGLDAAPPQQPPRRTRRAA